MAHICLVAGGTGGHIFPAISFGRWIRTNRPSLKVSFVCGSRPLEKEIYTSQGLDPVFLPLSGSPLGAAGVGETAQRWKESAEAFFSFRQYVKRNPVDCCVLFGGYVSFVPLLLCSAAGTPVIVHEQNAVAGKITRLASRMGKKVASGWDQCVPLPAGAFQNTGVPVRPVRRKEPGIAWEEILGETPFPGEKRIGVLGGSLMSGRLIQLISCLAEKNEEKEVVFLVLGAAKGTFSDDGQNVPRNTIFLGKQWDMTNFYSVLDAAITRGGASTLSELKAWGIPALVVPWPGASDGHQEANARCFAEETGGQVWKENEPLELLQERILGVLEKRPVRPETGYPGRDESERLWRLISSSIGREIM